ncbi:dihydroorotase [Fulvitalea axinellae]|uniref:Dihydroorotase n=1 Tax=Fulvitalea axinellae TaxID=1182444 RepID=A0AAU9CMT8_9BACT|nr:dihydroorotase [Fulvitalea axinellae]
MSVLITRTTIADKNSGHNGKTKNVLIEHGRITAITDETPKADKIIEGEGSFLSTGWFDMRSNFRDPGLEYKEDLQSGRLAAQAGGFTDVLLMPETDPVIATKNEIRYLVATNHDNLVQIHPASAVTLGLKGDSFTDMVDLHHAGAKAFTEGETPIHNSDILLKTLQYLQPINGLLINRPEDYYLSLFGLMHEGHQSTLMGTKGIPSLAETLMVQRDLNLLRYAGGKIHFAKISAKGTVEAIREAKAEGLQVTCDVAAHQLCFTDEDLAGFDTNLKVSPPFRSEEDRLALIDGLLDGTIDAIVSSHEPHDIECKRLEFDLADPGIIGLQTVFSTAQRGIPQDVFLEKVTVGPRSILGIESPKIAEGETACLTLFSPETKWTFDEKTNRSKSENSPFFGLELEGKVLATFNNNQIYIAK